MGSRRRYVLWKRFWISRHAVPEIANDYFADPCSEIFGRNLGLNIAAKTCHALDEKGCLVLPAEPGIGKSRVSNA